MPSIKGTSAKFSGFYQCNSRTNLFVRGNKGYHSGSRRRRAKSALSLLTSAERGSSILKVIYPSRSPLEELHHHFPFLPHDELPINVFTCALSKDILLQGRMFVTQNWICFYSNIFGYETKVKIEFQNIVLISREKTVFFVPNAISIATANKRYLFCSFLTRETVYKLLLRIWQAKVIDGKVDDKDGAPLSLTEEEVLLKDIPVEDYHSESMNAYRASSTPLANSLRRSHSYSELESSSFKTTSAKIPGQRRRPTRRQIQAGRATYPFVYDMSLSDLEGEPHKLLIQEWKTFDKTKSSHIDDLSRDSASGREQNCPSNTDKKLLKERNLCIKLIFGFFQLVFKLLWIISIILIFPFKRFSRQSLILSASFILFCVLTSMTIVMLSRVNDLSKLLEAGSPGQFSDPLCNGNDVVGQYSRYLDQKRLERAKNILKTNLIAVSQIHEALVKLNENLKT